MSLLDKFETYLAQPGKLSRRSAIGRLTQGCTALVAALAGVNLIEQTPVARASSCFGCHPHRVGPCCNLCLDPSICDDGACPSGTTRRYTWICYAGGCPWLCGECYCTTGAICSFTFPLCAPHCPCIPGTPSAESMLKFLPVRQAGEQCH
jgi:hypothetical protein